MSKLIKNLFPQFLCFMIAPVGFVNAELTSLSDNDLSEVDGAGIGLVMDDFVFSHGNDTANDKTFKISGLTNSNGDAVTVNVNQLYIARSGSNYGTNLEGVNLGRLDNPYEIDILDGDSIGLTGEAVLQISTSKKVDLADGYDCLDVSAVQGSGECSSRPANTVWDNAGTPEVWQNGERPDMGLELELQDGINTSNLNFNASSAVFDGSYVRLWGDETEVNNGKMAAEFRLNFYTPELEISTCSQSNQACGSSIKMQDFEMELALGNTFQPMYLGVDNITGGLTMEISAITHEYIDNIVGGVSDGSAAGNTAQAFFEDYYQNEDYRSNIVIGDLDISGTNLGSSKIEGMLIQYVDVKFRDLAL